MQEATKGLPDAEREYREALFDVMMRAIRQSEVKRSGNIVTLDLIGNPSEGEQRRITAFLNAKKEKSATAARVVRALASGKEPEPADLEALAGKELASRIDAENASAKSVGDND